METNSQINIPPVFIAHGGGPMPLMNDPTHEPMIQSLKELVSQIPKPEAILVISAHWEEKTLTILETPDPDLYFDYSGFPEECYTYKYKAPIAKEVNEKLKSLFEKNGISYKSEKKRGYDHGVFVPLLLMYPDADIPIAQISLVKTLDPEEHIKIGNAISSLSQEGVLILGSGFSYHNFQGLFNPTKQVIENNLKFHNYLKDTFENTLYSPEKRYQLLTKWKSAPGGTHCHPREEHLLPLMVVCGASEGKIGTIQEIQFGKILVLNIYFK